MPFVQRVYIGIVFKKFVIPFDRRELNCYTRCLINKYNHLFPFEQRVYNSLRLKGAVIPFDRREFINNLIDNFLKPHLWRRCTEDFLIYLPVTRRPLSALPV